MGALHFSAPPAIRHPSGLSCPWDDFQAPSYGLVTDMILCPPLNGSVLIPHENRALNVISSLADTLGGVNRNTAKSARISPDAWAGSNGTGPRP